MPSTLPSRLYRAMTVRVVHLNCILADIDVGFGVITRKNLLVDGVDCAAVPQAMRSDAMHCMVMLVGGRELLIHTDCAALDGFLKSQVYLSDDAPRAPKGTMSVPPGMGEPHLDIGLMWNWVADQRFNPRTVAWCFGRAAKGGA
jgi:hypothetical protein